LRTLKPNIDAVGAIDWDRRLFDELIPLPNGTSYNAYLVRGSEKTALIDTVDPEQWSDLAANLDRLDVKTIDYVVAQHGEQDHSGSIARVREDYGGGQVVTNPKCKGMLMDLLCLGDDCFTTVDDGQSLSLGDKTLQFIYTPWVHWPETMCTYVPEAKILFSCDFFGSHIASSFLFVDNEAVAYESAKRYYAEIMMPFRQIIKKNIEKLSPLAVDMIAPSHGFVYDRPDFITEAYQNWISDTVKNEVIIPYTSMHGSTRKMVEFFTTALMERGITVRVFDLAQSDLGQIAMAMVDAATIVIGTSTCLVGAHPNAAYAAFVTNALRPKARFASIIGSYGWGSKMVEQLTGMMGNLKVELLDPVVVKGYPKEDDFRALASLADTIQKKHCEAGIGP